MSLCEKIVLSESINQAAAINAIIDERLYQNQKWGTIQDRPRETGTYITLMHKLLRDAEVAFAESKGDQEALSELRKVVAVGLACFEQHGIPKRQGINKPSTEKQMLSELLNFISPASAPTNFPRIGEFWTEQGGYLGAIMRGKDTPDYCLIVSEKEREFTAEFGSRGKEIATSDWDGFANTKLMAEMGNYPSAEKCHELNINGFNDWFLGAKREMRALYANVSELFDPNPWYWTSTQCSASLAFCQDFELGDQTSCGKYYELRVRPVRRLFI